MTFICQALLQVLGIYSWPLNNTGGGEVEPPSVENSFKTLWLYSPFFASAAASNSELKTGILTSSWALEGGKPQLVVQKYCFHSAVMKPQIRQHVLKTMQSGGSSQFKPLLLKGQPLCWMRQDLCPWILLHGTYNFQLFIKMDLLSFSKFWCLVPPLEVFHDQVQATDYWRAPPFLFVSSMEKKDRHMVSALLIYVQWLNDSIQCSHSPRLCIET